MPAPDAATAVEVELLEELVPEAVPLALLPLADEDEPEVAEALDEAPLSVGVAVALAEPLLAEEEDEEAVPVESAPVLDAEAVDEPDAVADAEEEEDEPSVTLNWFYRAGECQQIFLMARGLVLGSKLTD